jgi:hypothetical protein
MLKRSAFAFRFGLIEGPEIRGLDVHFDSLVIGVCSTKFGEGQQQSQNRDQQGHTSIAF